MGSTKSSRSATRPGWFPKSSLAIACLLLSVSAAAEFGGGVRLGISHMDNVYLVPSPNETDDFIYKASPFLSFNHESSKLDANAQYTYDWYRYDDIGTTSKYQRGDARLTAKVLQEKLQLEVGARRSQVLSDPDGVIQEGNLPLSGNLVDEDEWWINPRFNQTLGRAVTLNADYRYSELQFDQSDTQDNSNQSGRFGLENYAAGKGLTWALRYDWRRTKYDVVLPWENQQASAELGFWVNAKTRLFASGGKESDWADPHDSKMTDPFWEAGFAYSAGENLSAEFAAGERTFGSSWRGNLDYTFRRGSTSLSYNQSPTTTGYNEGGIAPDEVDPDEFDDYLDRPGNSERYIRERLDWALNLKFRRTGIGFSVFDEHRSDVTTIDGTPLPNESQTGASANFSWQAGTRTEFVVSGSFVDRELSDTDKSRFYGAGLNVNYSLGTHSDISLGYRYSKQEPRGGSIGGEDYDSNVVSLNFTYTM